MPLIWQTAKPADHQLILKNTSDIPFFWELAYFQLKLSTTGILSAGFLFKLKLQVKLPLAQKINVIHENNDKKILPLSVWTSVFDSWWLGFLPNSHSCIKNKKNQPSLSLHQWLHRMMRPETLIKLTFLPLFSFSTSCTSSLFFYFLHLHLIFLSDLFSSSYLSFFTSSPLSSSPFASSVTSCMTYGGAATELGDGLVTQI